MPAVTEPMEAEELTAWETGEGVFFFGWPYATKQLSKRSKRSKRVNEIRMQRKWFWGKGEKGTKCEKNVAV